MKFMTTTVSYTGTKSEPTILQQMVLDRRNRGERTNIGRLVRAAVVAMYGEEMAELAATMRLSFVIEEVAQKQHETKAVNNER